MDTELKPESARQTGSRGVILIVEDDPLQREFLEGSLREQGFEPFGNGSPEEVFAWSCAHQPQAIILDLCFPSGCGLELCGRLVDHPATCSIPVIILSGSCDNDVVRKARAAGCRFFLGKPFDPNTLLLLIDQAIREAADY